MYTVRQLSRMAGVTPRTLHYYDQIGLLKPTRVAGNGYRYYGQEALLRLQQILLYRQLDLPLERIRRILEEPAFDVQAALESHRQLLLRKIGQIERQVQTVDHTLLYLKGKMEMSPKQLFEAISDEQQAEYEQEAMQLYDPEIVKASNRKWRSYSVEEKQRIGEEGNAAYQQLLEAMPFGPASVQAQSGVESWRRHMDYFWTPDDQQLLGLADLYNDDPRFKANFDKIDPGLAAFVREAVKVYVNKRKQ